MWPSVLSSVYNACKTETTPHRLFIFSSFWSVDAGAMGKTTRAQEKTDAELTG